MVQGSSTTCPFEWNTPLPSNIIKNHVHHSRSQALHTNGIETPKLPNDTMEKWLKCDACMLTHSLVKGRKLEPCGLQCTTTFIHINKWLLSVKGKASHDALQYGQKMISFVAFSIQDAHTPSPSKTLGNNIVHNLPCLTHPLCMAFYLFSKCSRSSWP